MWDSDVFESRRRQLSGLTPGAHWLCEARNCCSCTAIAGAMLGLRLARNFEMLSCCSHSQCFPGITDLN